MHPRAVREQPEASPLAAGQLGGGLAWAPGSFFDQDGRPIPSCARGTLTRIEDRLAGAGLQALVGHEFDDEWVVSASIWMSEPSEPAMM